MTAEQWAVIRNLYPASERFWRENGIEPKLGFKILNGPPRKNAPFLFIGYQPGGGAEDWELEKKKGTHQKWPDVCEYATERQWRLVERMQRIFDVDLLKCCVGTNAIFLRYENEKQYARSVGEKRKVVERFCRDCLRQIVEAIQPQQVVTIGFKTLQMFGPTTRELVGAKRTIIKLGTVLDRPAIGLIHLAGGRPSNADLKAIADYLKRRRRDQRT